MKSLTRRVAESAMWMVLLRSAVRILGLISTIILARLLTPTDFGLVAMATLVSGMVEIMSQFGFDLFILRRKEEPTREDYGTAWTLTILRGLFIALALVALAGWAADFFNEPRMTAMIYVLAAAAFVEGFQNIYLVTYQRNLDFRVEFGFHVSKKLVMILTTITLAFLTQSYWALMAGIVVSRIFGVGLSYIISKERPIFTLKHAGETFSFSKWIMLSNLTFYIRNNADQWLIGRVMAPSALGIYLLAKEISELPTTELVYPIQRTLLPGFSRLSDDLSAMRHAYLRAFSTIFQIGAPIGIGLGLVAEPLVTCLLGSKWLEVAPVLQIMGLYGALRVASSAAGPVYFALGKPHLDAALTLAMLVAGLPFLWWGATQYGLTGTVYGMLAMTAIGVPLHLATVGRLLSVSAGDFFRVVWRTCAGLLVMCGAVIALDNAASWPADIIGAWVQLFALSFVGALAYVSSVAALWLLSGAPQSCEREMANMIGSALASVTGKRLAA